jgi:predicted secreted protein
MVEGITCCRGDFAIGRNLSPGDGANDAAKGVVAGLIFAKRIFENSSLEILRSDGAHGRNFIRVQWPSRRQWLFAGHGSWRDAKRCEETFLTSAHDNEGTLILLDSELHELPGDVPHTLARVTGNRQRNIAFLSEADDGRMVELKPGEVFLLRLRGNPKTGAVWTSDRPETMALMESDTNTPPDLPGNAVQTASQQVTPGTRNPDRQARKTPPQKAV